MDLDKFHAAVKRIRAEQFFEEKTASAPAVSAVQLIGLARASTAEDPELLKLAHTYCPEAPQAFYEKLGGKFKTAVSHGRIIDAVSKTLDPARLRQAGTKANAILSRATKLTPAVDQADTLRMAAHIKREGRLDDLALLRKMRT